MGAQKRPPIRQIGPVIAESRETFGSVIAVRPLSDGRALLIDVAGRRVLLFDNALKTRIVVVDSTSATSNAFGGRTGGLISYRGDSTLFVDPAALSMLVIDPLGKIARVMSVPRTQDAGVLADVQVGVPGYDSKGRLIYRAPPHVRPPTFGSGGMTTPPSVAESTAIVRIHLASRQLDTVGFARIPKVKIDIAQSDNGALRFTTQLNPLPVVDDWAVLPDGTVAFVRGTDYHVDWINADGSKVSSPKISFDWQRLSDDDKVAFIDSVKTARARLIASQSSPQTMVGTRPRGEGGRDARGSMPSLQVIFVAASELPDYKPAFFSGSTRADTEGNLWIRTIPTKAIPGGPVYDVIDRKGELVDRVQVPINTLISGFGPNGTVYLALTDNKVQYLEIARAR